jgi:NitT/TauT family transport system substrate-binding protein
MDRTRLPRLLTAGLCALGLVACQAPPAAPGAPAASSPATAAPAASPPVTGPAEATRSVPTPPTAITVHNFANTVNTAIVQHGIEKGYYPAEGIDLTLQPAQATVGVQLVASGHLPFSLSPGTALPGALRGLPLRVVFVSAFRPLWWMYADPSITRVEDLRGKRIGLSTAGSSLTIVGKLLLERHGIGPDDASLLNVASEQRFPALQSGAIDAAFLVAPTNMVAARAGFRELFASHTEGVGLITEGMAANADFVQQQPDVMRRMMRATVRSLDAMRKDRPGAIATIARFTDVSPDEAEQVYDLGLPSWTTNGVADAATIRQSLDIMKIVAEVADAVEESQAFDLHYTREAAGELGIP